MKRTQLYLDEGIAKTLSAISRQRGTTVSSLVRECVRGAFGPKKEIDKAALALEIAGLWKDRTEFKATGPYVRKLRKGRRLKNLFRG